MPPVAGDQVVGKGLHRAFQDADVVALNHFREPPGFDDGGRPAAL